MTGKIHEPTANRLRRARSDGDVPVSSAATRWAGFVTGVVLLPSLLVVVGLRCIDLLKRAALQPPLPGALLDRVIQDLAITVLPWLGALALATILITALQSKAWLDFRQVSPKPQRLNPLRAIQQLIDAHHWLGLLVALSGALILGGIGLYFIFHHLQSFANAADRPLAAAPLVLWMTERLLWGAAAVATAVAAIDWLIRRSAWRERLRMTHVEWLDDQKNTYGHPAVRAERTRQHRDLLNDQP